MYLKNSREFRNGSPFTAQSEISLIRPVVMKCISPYSRRTIAYFFE